MSVIRVTKEFRFEAAHALAGYDGACRNAHGHSYVLSVTVAGTPVSDPSSPKLGMVIDFGDLKRLIRKHIVDPFDHALLRNGNYPAHLEIPAGEPFTNVVYLPYQPTSENLLADVAARIMALLPAQTKLFSLRLRETDTSFAEWFASDQG